ncbi:MAG: single-stranded-DNA-specific exonuclease RecJ, partial [Microcystaceae cyanobacterium]
MSLPLENLPLFQEAMNQKLWQQYPEMTQLQPQLAIDLIVTVADLGKALFQELKLLEPCGMGNPVPKLAIKQCQIQQISSKNIQDQKKAKISDQKTSFVLLDETVTEGFPGVWWGHSQ